MPTLHAIDLSHHNTVSSFPKIKAAGVVGVIHKATENTTYVDKQYAPRMKDALAAGLKWSAYHFLRPGNIAKQMEFFVKTAALPPGSRLCLDYEDDSMSLDELVSAVDWLVANAPGYQLSVYSGHTIKDKVGNDYVGTLAAKTSLWLAQYTTGTPSWPKNTWPIWSLWQYTDKGTVDGVSGPVDGNMFNGNAEQCAKWFGPVEVQPQPEPVDPDYDTPTISIQTTPGVKVLINGKEVATT